MRASLAAAAALWVAAALCVVDLAASHGEYECRGSSDAIAALQSNANITVRHTKGVGYAFLISSALVVSLAIPPTTGGPNLTRGVVIFPEEDVAPEAYAPLARELALMGSYAVILEKATPGRALLAMMQKPHLEFWILAGHGKGGAVAAHLALTLQPKVKALILLAAPMPKDVDMTGLNVIVVALYGQKDTVVTPKSVEGSFSRLPGDAEVTSFPHLGHYDFAKSKCVDQGPTDEDFATITSKIFIAILSTQWAAATKKALSFSDNERLTPGRNVSKPYPGDIRVQFTKAPIPDTSPQRFWWVFTPTQIKGGLVYYPGLAVDSRAYFPLAFEIAARGHLVVIVQMPMRTAPTNFQEANTVIDSKLPLFSGVPKGKWAVGGHSYGGWATSLYVAEFGDKIYAAAMHSGFWAANLTQNPLPIANIYGTLDNLIGGGFDRYRYMHTDPPPRGIGPLVNLNTSRFITIEGANHYQVGDYGYQAPDEIATISSEQQVAAFADATVAFLDDAAAAA